MALLRHRGDGISCFLDWFLFGFSTLLAILFSVRLAIFVILTGECFLFDGVVIVFSGAFQAPTLVNAIIDASVANTLTTTIMEPPECMTAKASENNLTSTS